MKSGGIVTGFEDDTATRDLGLSRRNSLQKEGVGLHAVKSLHSCS